MLHWLALSPSQSSPLASHSDVWRSFAVVEEHAVLPHWLGTVSRDTSSISATVTAHICTLTLSCFLKDVWVSAPQCCPGSGWVTCFSPLIFQIDFWDFSTLWNDTKWKLDRKARREIGGRHTAMGLGVDSNVGYCICSRPPLFWLYGNMLRIFECFVSSMLAWGWLSGGVKKQLNLEKLSGKMREHFIHSSSGSAYSSVKWHHLHFFPFTKFRFFFLLSTLVTVVFFYFHQKAHEILSGLFKCCISNNFTVALSVFLFVKHILDLFLTHMGTTVWPHYLLILKILSVFVFIIITFNIYSDNVPKA